MRLCYAKLLVNGLSMEAYWFGSEHDAFVNDLPDKYNASAGYSMLESAIATDKLEDM